MKKICKRLLLSQLKLSHKTLLTMKVSFFLTLITLNVSAIVHSQDVKLNIIARDKSLIEVIRSIEKQSNYRFFFSDNYQDLNSLVSLDMQDKTISEVLSGLLDKTAITYKILDNNIVVITPIDNIYQQQKITGTVNDSSTGEALPGVSIQVEGTNIGSISNTYGKFSIDVPSQSSVLIFSYIGYLSEKVVVSDQTIIDVKLVPDIKKLEEVVVVGYGVQKKSNLTGAISQVKESDMKNRTIARAEQALQGKTAGVQIIQTSGAPGASPTVRVRGFSSNGPSDPLYVIDGLRTTNIGSVDPGNIESIEVLKDAASAAIYGAEAGNGVILITTKTGKKGVTRISYDYQYAVNNLARIPKVLNAKEYINYMTEGNIITANDVATLWDGKTDTDWTKVAFENSITQKHGIGIQGGNDRGTYYVSLTNLDQNGIIKGDDDVYHRLTAMINADYLIQPWLKIGTTNTMEKWDYKSVSENSEYGSLLASVLEMDPLTPDVYDADQLPQFMKDLLASGRKLLRNEKGQYYGISRIYEADQVHPMIMRDKSDTKHYGANVLGTMYASLTPVKGLTITSKVGYTLSFNNSYTFDNKYYVNAVAHNDSINVSRTAITTTYYQWENFANYDIALGKHKITTMAGISYSDTYATTVTAGGNAITKDDPLFKDIGFLTAGATKTVSGGYNPSPRKYSYFGRLIYDYANKYLFQASVRRDAADEALLPSTNRWGTFPAFSAGYVISNESFFPKYLNINHMKLRASWGQNGSLGPLMLTPYSYEGSISSTGTYPFTDAIAYQIASSPSKLNNPELKWETSEQLDLGLDIRVLKDRLTFTLDYYNKKTKDLLVAITPTYETGVTSSIINAGNVSNKGIELELGWTDRIKDFSYSVRGNLATLKNKVTYLDPSISRIAGASNHTATGITAFEIDKPVWYMRGYKLSGIDPATGDPVFQDQNNDGVINDADKVQIGTGIPNVTYGITMTAAYKGIDLTVFGTGSQGNDIYNCLTRIDRPRGNKLKVFYDDRWTPEHTDASRPRPNANGEDKYWQSSGVIFDGSFFKVKQIQLGYSLPQNLIKKVRMNNLRMYVSFEDWFVLTKYPGMDPEASAGSTSAMGIDKGSYPTSKKAVFGINVTF